LSTRTAYWRPVGASFSPAPLLHVRWRGIFVGVSLRRQSRRSGNWAGESPAGSPQSAFGPQTACVAPVALVLHALREAFGQPPLLALVVLILALLIAVALPFVVLLTSRREANWPRQVRVLP